MNCKFQYKYKNVYLINHVSDTKANKKYHDYTDINYRDMCIYSNIPIAMLLVFFYLFNKELYDYDYNNVYS